MMMKKIYLFFALVTYTGVVKAQTAVGIGTIAPAPSSILDLSSTSKGLLIPRMTAAQRTGIQNPATGLQVYQTDATTGLYYFDGARWMSQSFGLPVDSSGNTAYYGSVTTFAGNALGGFADGIGTAATFSTPYGICTGPNGMIYVADQGSGRIRRITPGAMVTTIAGGAGYGNTDGPAAVATFMSPSGVCTDPSGNIYVSDRFSHKIRKITPAGMVSTFAGSGTAGFADGTGTSASFNTPYGICSDAGGNIYVADFLNHRIRKITPAGIVTSLAGSGTQAFADGTGTLASFARPTGVCADAAGNLYVADVVNRRIRKVTQTGDVTTIAGTGVSGGANGPGATATFAQPNAIAIDATNALYVADIGNNNIRKISPDGEVSTVAGSGAAGSADGPSAIASFAALNGICEDGNGTLYVTTGSPAKVRRITTKPQYLTEANLLGYAKTSDLASYLKPADLAPYATIASLSNYAPLDTLDSFVRLDPTTVVDTFSNQTIGGLKSFLNDVQMNGKLSLGGAPLTYRLNISGPNNNPLNGPNIAVYTASDNYPLFNCVNMAHDNISINFDGYFDGYNRSSIAGAAFQIQKFANRFWINYATSSVVGGLITYSPGIVLSNGDVGIGTSAPTAKLSVNGTANNTTGSWGVFSDARIKIIDSSFTDGLNVITQIKPIRFHYKASAPFFTEKQQIGILAQELERIAPYMVSKQEGAGFPDLRQVDNQAYTFLLINAVQQQQAQIDARTKELEEQGSVLSRLEAEYEKLNALTAAMKLLEDQRNSGVSATTVQVK